VIFLLSKPGIADGLISSPEGSIITGPLLPSSIIQSPIVQKSVTSDVNDINLPSGSSGIKVGEVTDTSSLASSVAPTPKAPSGTISDRTPSYTWTKVSGATNYYYQLIQGAKTVYSRYVTPSACGVTYCTDTPAITLGLVTYGWHVKAKIGNVWQSYSPWKYFTVSDPPFNTPFTGNAPGWSVVNGTWTFLSGGYYQNTGNVDRLSSIVHAYNYPTLNYQAKIKRTGCKSCANSLVIRGTVRPLEPTGYWNKAYLFEYANDKQFSVWEITHKR
jgi:hypothetical protein